MTPLLQVEHVSLSFGGLHVARDISLQLMPGDRIALIGPNGAGKTTFVNLVSGALKPSAGRILLGGEDVTGRSDVARTRLGLVRSFQVTRLFPALTVAEHVALAVLHRAGHGGGMVSAATRAPGVADETRALLAGLGLDGTGQRVVATLPYGQQRLLEIALALALKPRVLLLDEPAAGVPQAESERILTALRALPDGLAVLMVEHDMDLVGRFATGIVVLSAGQVIAQGLPAEVMANEAVRTAYLGSYGRPNP